MAYSLPSDVRHALTGRPTVPENSSAATLSDALLIEHIEDADLQIDAALNDRYDVPFADPAPALVQSISAEIAAWLATTSYRQSSEIRDNDSVQRRYVRAMLMLTALSEGKASLPEITEGIDATAGGDASLFNMVPFSLWGYDLLSGLPVYPDDGTSAFLGGYGSYLDR